MGIAKMRKNEIELVKTGKAIRLNPAFDDYDAAADVIKKAAKFVFEDWGNGSYAYHIESWMGKELAKGSGDEALKSAINEGLLIGENADRVKRVKGAVLELLNIFSEQFMIDRLSPDGGKNDGRITSQKELDNAVSFFCRPIFKNCTFGNSKPVNLYTIATKGDDGKWNTAYVADPNGIAALFKAFAAQFNKKG